jgi:uncharacterized protein (TIGR03437 family)
MKQQSHHRFGKQPAPSEARLYVVILNFNHTFILMLKYCAVFSLCAATGLAADFMTGMSARAVIGQTTFTSQNSGASNTLLGGVGGIAYANNTLFVTDANRLGNVPINNRVLIFNNISHMLPSATAEIGPNTGRCPVCVQGANLALGQPDFTSINFSTTAAGMRLPTSVATDGRTLAVADTANNRVLIWKQIPSQMGQPADIVLGQPDFTTVQQVVVNQTSLRAPQGVWIQNGRIFVADTQNNRVMIWNSFPTKNNQPADLVLGQPNFTTSPNLDLTKSSLTAAANTLLNPVGVSSDGVRLIVTDLGFNRVLIWNTIPTKTQQPADIEIGQKDFTTSEFNDNNDLCVSTGADASGNPMYPSICNRTLSFPRFALSDGQRLFIADGGNDRVLIFNTIPTANAPAADVILGQPDQYNDILVTSTNDIFDPNLFQSASNVTPSPTGLAWDGTNLYVTDSLNYRVLVFTPGSSDVPGNGVVNSASQAIYAQGSITFSGTITAGNVILIQIDAPSDVQSTYYVYTVVAADTLDTITTNVTNLINQANDGAGDPNVLALAQISFESVQLIARQPGGNGNNISIAASTGTSVAKTTTTTNGATYYTQTVSGTPDITATASGSVLAGGGNAATLAPGTIISIKGANLSDNTAVAVSQPSYSPNLAPLPLQLGGVEVYIDGIRAPIQAVSPTQIDVQVPFELIDTNSSSLYVRTLRNSGAVTVTTSVPLQVSQQAPGIYAEAGPEPRKGTAVHYSSYATGVISVDGSAQATDIVTVTIENRPYNYTVLATDTLNTIRDALVALINANGDEKVVAAPSGSFTRIVLRAKVPGSEGNGLSISASANGGTFTSSTGVVTTGTPTETMTAINSFLCCANVAGAPVNADNPAQPGELIGIFATGLGLVGPASALASIQDGVAYSGPALNDPNSSVSSIIGGSTGNVLYAGLQVGAIGVYYVVLQLDSGLPTNPITQVTISQDIYTSNIVYIPVVSPNPANGVNP